MDFKLIGSPCGQHGPYTFYKAFKYSKHGKTNILGLSEFFFVKLWNDSDLVSIGELQLLWEDKNSEHTLASLRLYILPENTPEGRSDCHGEHEVLAITEKVVLRVEDLLTWITEAADWSWGLAAVYDQNAKLMPRPNLLSDNSFIDLAEVDKEKDMLGQSHWDTQSGVVVLSFPRYCRYRGILKRLEGVHNKWLRTALVLALGGFTVPCRNTKVLYCKETFDYPDLEGHELLCNHLAPKLKGRPRKKRKLLDLSPESSDSDSSSDSSSSSSSKLKYTPQRSLLNVPRRPPRPSHNSSEEKDFFVRLNAYMKVRQTPINRVPTIGFKELDLYKLFGKVRHLGGYDVVTASRLWKYVYEEMGGDQSSTSAATCCRRHYERLLLPYERHLTPSRSKTSVLAKLRKFEEISITTKSSSSSMKPTSNFTSKKQKLEILKEGGLEVTAISGVANGRPVEKARPSVIQPTARASESQSITITPDLGHMLPSKSHAWSMSSRVYGNPKEVGHGDTRPLDLTTKTPPGSNLEITLVPPVSSAVQIRAKKPQLTIPVPHRQNLAQKLHNPSHQPPRPINQKIPTPTTSVANGRAIVPSVSISVNQQKRKSKGTVASQSSQSLSQYSMMDPVYLSAFYSGLFTPQQVQFYKELLDQHNIPDSFPRLLQDGSTSISLVNQTPTPPSK